MIYEYFNYLINTFTWSHFILLIILMSIILFIFFKYEFQKEKIIELYKENEYLKNEFEKESNYIEIEKVIKRSANGQMCIPMSFVINKHVNLKKPILDEKGNLCFLNLIPLDINIDFCLEHKAPLYYQNNDGKTILLNYQEINSLNGESLQKTIKILEKKLLELKNQQ